MAIHFAVAAALTALLGWWPSAWTVAAAVILLFVAREQCQQSAKEHPPENVWAFWTWGPRGKAEALVAFPGALGAAALIQFFE